MQIVVYVPIDGTYAFKKIARGAGVVGTKDPHSGLVTIDYEGNVHGMQNLGKFVERLLSAADRHVCRYPTTARMVVPSAELLPVATFDTETRRIDYKGEEGWLTATWWFESPNLEAQR